MRAGYVRFRALDIDQRRAFCLARSNRRFNPKRANGPVSFPRRRVASGNGELAGVFLTRTEQPETFGSTVGSFLAFQRGVPGVGEN